MNLSMQSLNLGLVKMASCNWRGGRWNCGMGCVHGVRNEPGEIVEFGVPQHLAWVEIGRAIERVVG